MSTDVLVSNNTYTKGCNVYLKYILNSFKFGTTNPSVFTAPVRYYILKQKTSKPTRGLLQTVSIILNMRYNAIFNGLENRLVFKRSNDIIKFKNYLTCIT